MISKSNYFEDEEGVVVSPPCLHTYLREKRIV